jgi:hypothetical protein
MWGHRLRRPRTGHVVDLLFLNRSVQVIHSKPESRLRNFDARRDPERLHVRDVVEHQASNCVDA